ncbi:MAG: putative quinol monooxygenase [Planctomycetota bacterium]|jgi:quinol monooxygenase YgiN
MICVIARIEVAEGRRQDFLDEFHKVVPKVLQEPGCIEYAPMIDVPTSIGAQAPPRNHTVTVVEKWDSIEALEAHLVAPHMIDYRKAVRSIVLGASLEILEPA